MFATSPLRAGPGATPAYRSVRDRAIGRTRPRHAPTLPSSDLGETLRRRVPCSCSTRREIFHRRRYSKDESPSGLPENLEQFSLVCTGWKKRRHMPTRRMPLVAGPSVPEVGHGQASCPWHPRMRQHVHPTVNRYPSFCASRITGSSTNSPAVSFPPTDTLPQGPPMLAAR